jgi:small subunit ribosomal protein S6e
MANFKVVVSDPKTKSYQFDVTGDEANNIIGKSIGETLDGNLVGLPGYTLKITGGNDKDGFTMRGDLPGVKRHRILMSGGVGDKPKSKGERKRKFVRGKEISSDTVQINTKVVEYGNKSIDAILGGGEEAAAEE